MPEKASGKEPRKKGGRNMAKEEIGDRPEAEEIKELINIVKQLNPMSLALMQNSANVLLMRDKLEEQASENPKQTA